MGFDACCRRLLCAHGAPSEATPARAERGGLDFSHDAAWRVSADSRLDRAATLDLQAGVGREAAISRIGLELLVAARGRHPDLGAIWSGRDLRPHRVF